MLEARPAPLISRGAVAVLVPARNEAAQIVDTIVSLQSQTHPPESIIVIANGCSDNTADLARATGVTVTEMEGNKFKKAGALNHGIELLLSQPSFPEFVVTIDADTVLDHHFIERSMNVLNQNDKLGGVSAVCRGKDGLGDNIYQRILVWLQSAEYARAGMTRLRYNIHTMSGAGSTFRCEAIFDVLRDRGKLYLEHAGNLVEDYEATLEVKRHGWECTNNFYCIARTDLMLSMRSLLIQRIRWVRGSVDELRERGWKPETKHSILALGFAMFVMPLFYIWIGLIVYTWLSGNFGWHSALLLGLICMYQAFTVWTMGWKSMLVSFTLLPELCFNLLRHTWLIASFVQSYRSKQQAWE